MKQCNLTKGIVVFLTIMITLFCGVVPSFGVQPSDGFDCDCCEDLKVEGCYALMHKGEMIMPVPTGLLAPDPPFIQLQVKMASVGVFHIDRNGSITGKETVRLLFPPSPGVDFPPLSFTAQISGELMVNDDCDCTGIAKICVIADEYVNPDPDGLHGPGIESTMSFVITGKGQEIQLVTTDMASCGDIQIPAPFVYVPIDLVGTAKKICDD